MLKVKTSVPNLVLSPDICSVDLETEKIRTSKIDLRPTLCALHMFRIVSKFLPVFTHLSHLTLSDSSPAWCFLQAPTFQRWVGKKHV